MFLNKAKEQLGPEKASAPSFPHSSASSTSTPHYPTAVLAIPGSLEAGAGVRVVPKQEGSGGTAGGGGGSGGSNSGSASLSVVGGHLHQSHTSQNITVVPVPSTGIMTAGELALLPFFLLASSHVLHHFHSLSLSHIMCVHFNRNICINVDLEQCESTKQVMNILMTQ